MNLKFSKFKSNLGNGARSLLNLTDPKRRKKCEKVDGKFNSDNYLVKVEGG